MINNQKTKNIYRIIWVLIAVIATIFTFTDHVSFMGGDGRPSTLFFTSWSVWLCLLTSILCIVPTIQKKNSVQQWVMLVKFCANIMIIATFVVAAFVLPDKLWTAGYWNPGSIFKHFLLPILTIADTVMFDEKDSYKVYYPIVGVVVPMLYWVIVVARICSARNALGGALPANLWDFYYPYGFTNFDNGHSLAGLCKILAGISVGLLLIGYGFFFGKKSYKK